MEDYQINHQQLRQDLRAVLEKHGVVQNLHLTPSGPTISVTGQLRPVNPKDQQEVATYRAAQPQVTKLSPACSS